MCSSWKLLQNCSMRVNLYKMILQILITGDYKSNGNYWLKCGILPVNIYMVLLQRSCVYKQQAVCWCRSKHDFALSPPPVVQQSFQCLWAVKCTHAAEVWKHRTSGIMLTDPLSRFPQSLLSHKEQCHVAKFMRSAFCLLFLACQKVLFRRQAAQTSLRSHRPVHLQNRTLLTHWLCPRCLFVSAYCPNQLIKVNSQPVA